MSIPIIIPAYEPDEQLPALLRDLDVLDTPVVVVDDGSGPDYSAVFDEVRPLVEQTGGTLISYPDNCGKGAALKRAFAYALDTWPDLVGVVTADSDGQHTPACIGRVRAELERNPSALVLGERTFTGDDVPVRSRAGNTVTAHVFGALFGLHVHDTQTGLRGIPAPLMERCLTLDGDRFDFEMQMLAVARDTCPVTGIPIETIYESKTDHRSHYRTVTDSARIARVLLREPVKGGAASLATEAAEIAGFLLVRRTLAGRVGGVLVAALASRVGGEALAAGLAHARGKALTADDAKAAALRIACGSGATALLTPVLGGRALGAKVVSDVCLLANAEAFKRIRHKGTDAGSGEVAAEG